MFRIFSFVALFLVVSASGLRASHYLGGEITYVPQPNNQYEIAVRIYQDCLNGQQGAIEQDIPLFLTIYTGAGTLFATNQNIPAASINVLPVGALPGCLRSNANLCVRLTECKWTVTLPPSPTGYVIVNDRCCAPENVMNIVQPGQQGLALRAVIPASGVATGNTSPTFRTAPPMQVCAGQPFAIDFGANDADGDAVVHTIVPTLRGTASNNDPKPNVAAFNLQPVVYQSPYSATAPVGPGATLTLDSASGRLSGTVALVGNYLISVQAQDVRGGTALGSIRRTYPLLVTACTSEPDAVIERDEAAVASGADSISVVRCGGARTVAFKNMSTGAGGYWWNFGDPATTVDTSTATSPSYTYPGPGRYAITLVAYGPSCNDTLRTLVVLSDGAQPVAEFSIDGVTGPLCAGLPYFFRSSNNDPTLPDQNLVWRFVEPGGETYATYGTPVQYFTRKQGQLSVRHVVVSAGGCIGVREREVEVEGGNVWVSSDTTVVKETPLVLTATGGASYEWFAIPPANISGGSVMGAQLPVFTGNVDTGFRFVCISTGINGCRDYDTVRVTVSEKAYAFVPTAFSPNGDGLNDLLRVWLSGANLYHFAMYNRWGQEVWRTTNARVGWDGTFRGAPLADGVYVWMARMLTAGGVAVESGNVTLVR